MAIIKEYKKNIACLGTAMYSTDQNLNIQPTLELLSKNCAIDYLQLTCHTKNELKFNLDALRTKNEYQIIYFAFRGSKGAITLEDGSIIELTELTDLMVSGFKDKIIRLGGKMTMDIPEKSANEFMRRTNVSVLMGNVKNAEWDESVALDTLLFSWLQIYPDFSAFWQKFYQRYSGLITTSGFEIYY